MFKDKDPVIDQLRTMIKDEFGGCDYSALNKIHEAGGPTVGCMANWFFGETKRPQNPTVEAAGRSFGYQRVWQKLKGK
jgi:hypothetical protein